MLQCGKTFVKDDIIILNGTDEDTEDLVRRIDARRIKAKLDKVHLQQILIILIYKSIHAFLKRKNIWIVRFCCIYHTWKNTFFVTFIINNANKNHLSIYKLIDFQTIQ